MDHSCHQLVVERPASGCDRSHNPAASRIFEMSERLRGAKLIARGIRRCAFWRSSAMTNVCYSPAARGDVLRRQGNFDELRHVHPRGAEHCLPIASVWHSRHTLSGSKLIRELFAQLPRQRIWRVSASARRRLSRWT